MAFLSTRLSVSRRTVPVALSLLTAPRAMETAQAGLTASLAPLELVQPTCRTILLPVRPNILLPVIQLMARLPIRIVSVQGRVTASP